MLLPPVGETVDVPIDLRAPRHEQAEPVALWVWQVPALLEWAFSRASWPGVS